jgi:phage terminase large subunit
MKQYKIWITGKSINLKKEFDNYVWMTNKDGVMLDKPIDMFNHWIDASRYAVSYFLKKNNEVDIFIW